MPGAVTVIGFEVTGFPLPNRPIWLNGEGLQLGGWQTAVIAAAPGKMGVTVPAAAAGIVVGVVDSNSRAEAGQDRSILVRRHRCDRLRVVRIHDDAGG